jgi:hypothetical protein
LALFTESELEEIRKADEEIERQFALSAEDETLSRNLDRQAKVEQLDIVKQRKVLYGRAYRKANKEKIKALRAAWYQANREKIRAQQFENYHKDRKASAAKSLYYYRRNRDEINRRRRERYAQKKKLPVCETESN